MADSSLRVALAAVGKTSLLIRYTNDKFSDSLIATAGVDFKIKNLDLEGKKTRLLIWDTAGQDRYRSITRSFFRGTQGVAFVYDVTSRSSFISVRGWMADMREHSDVDAVPILIGNKADLVDERAVSEEEGRALAAEYGMLFFETSARDGSGVDSAFEGLARASKARVCKDDTPEAPAYGQEDRRVKLGKQGGGRTQFTCC
jgi:Ras-related protein Rab-8A